jgi:phage terminase large subunit GpA-like protein
MSYILQGFLDGLRPIPIMTVSEWADKNVYLTTDSAAEPGRYSTDRTPYLREPFDCLSPNSPVTRIVIMKGVQLGMTTHALNVFGCWADISPCTMMYLLPTIDVVKGFSDSRVDPMINNCPALVKKIKPSRERDSGNTKLVKKFPGGSLYMSGANSSASLASRPIRNLLADEVDRYPKNVDGEGSPVYLAEKRQSTYGMKKKTLLFSTPTTEAESVIEPEYLDTDQRKYFVPCPHCGSAQELIFSQLRWEVNKPDTACYECVECKETIAERHKTKMLEAGYWKPTNLEKQTPFKRGYHINSLYSPIGWTSWADIVCDFEKAEKDENLMIGFTNTILAETWKVKVDVPDWNHLYNKREIYELNKPNKNIVFITAGVDVQKDRIECHIIGWCRGKVSYSLDYRVLIGETTMRDVWDQLAEIVEETWIREDGTELPMRLMAVDSGYNTTHVYDFCKRFSVTKVIPIKGKDNLNLVVSSPRQVDTTSAGKKIGKTKVWSVGSSIIKSEIYGWLKLQKDESGIAPNGYMHFPQYSQEFFRGMTAEHLQVSIRKGYKSYEWVKKYHQNEPLDTTVYARAAAAVVGLDRFKDSDFTVMEKSFFNQKKTSSEVKSRRDIEDSIW